MTKDEVPGGKQEADAGPPRSDGPDQPGSPTGQGPHSGRGPGRPRRPADMDSNPGLAWNVVGTLGAGIAFWGFVGWGIDRLTHLHHVFLPIGIVLGLAAAIYLVIYQALRR